MIHLKRFGVGLGLTAFVINLILAFIYLALHFPIFFGLAVGLAFIYSVGAMWLSV